jgi:hypothetical protein
VLSGPDRVSVSENLPTHLPRQVLLIHRYSLIFVLFS